MKTPSEYIAFLTAPKGEGTKYTNITRAVKGLGHPMINTVPHVIDIPAGAHETVHLDDTYKYVTIQVGAGAHVTLRMASHTPDQTWSCQMMNLILASNAVCHHIVHLDDSGVRTILCNVRVERDARYHLVQINTSTGLSRQDIHIALQQQARAQIDAVQLGAGTAHHDLTACITHFGPQSTSQQRIRNILTGTAHGVYQGKIHVDTLAAKTDAAQSCKTILLSNVAEVNVKPELEIYTDDVACAHGASCGALDENQLFYLQSRGVDEVTARALLLRGFVADVLPDEMIEKVDDWLRGGLS